MTWQTRTYTELTRPVRDFVPADKKGKIAKAFETLRFKTVGDLLNHLPRRYFAGAESSDLGALVAGEDVAVVAHVVSAKRRYGTKPHLAVVISDGLHQVGLTFFGRTQYQDSWARQLEPGRRGIFIGKVGAFRDEVQLTNPSFVLLTHDGTSRSSDHGKQAILEAVTSSALVGIYPQAKGLRTWEINRAARHALHMLADIADPLPDAVRRRAGVVGWHRAMEWVHSPDTMSQVGQGQYRLRFDEAFVTQLAMAKRRYDARQDPATARPRRSGGILDALDARLPFRLTDGQRDVSDTLFTELAGTVPMQRLLQGEVGSGKTVVALRAMLAVVDAGGQAALLAPTEVLAAQHAFTLRHLLGSLADGGALDAPEHATRITVLTGSMPAGAKREARALIKSGEAGIVVGTHALLSDDVEFADLGLIVIDEQHRFGVEQRGTLARKASTRPHLLVMTATPIPRSVAMTVFGDLDVSSLTEVPRGRADVATTVVDTVAHPAWVERAWARVGEEVAAGRQAFVVAPKITPQDPETLVEGQPPSASVEQLFADLTAGPWAGLRVGLLHGKLPADVKDRTMAQFAAGDLDVLVATTVIEVGVDVPNASAMIICDADRFGISQLHQLRGRIGRGAHPGVCLLLTAAPADTPARERLDAVAATRDGFELADVDLAQRREGDVLGAAQSGRRSSLRLLSVLEDRDLILKARAIAEECVEQDPALSDPLLADAVAYVDWLAANEAWDNG